MKYSIAYVDSSVDGEPFGVECHESIGSVVGTSGDGAGAWKIGGEDGADVFGIGGKSSAQINRAFDLVGRTQKRIQ